MILRASRYSKTQSLISAWRALGGAELAAESGESHSFGGAGSMITLSMRIGPSSAGPPSSCTLVSFHCTRVLSQKIAAATAARKSPVACR